MAAPLAALQIGFSALNAAVRQSQAKKFARATEKAARANAALQIAELTRQQEEVNRLAGEEVSDTIRRANQELGALRAVAGDAALSGSSFQRLVVELGAVEGLDLSRIEMNRINRLEALQSAKKKARQDYINIVKQAYNNARAEQLDAAFDFIGDIFQISMSQIGRQQEIESAQNRTDG